MTFYEPPLRDLDFVLYELLRAEEIGEEGVERDTVMAVLGEAGRVCAEVLAPLNQPGDQAGCRLADGQVTTPPGFPAAWRALADGGWAGLACDPADGGQGLPELVQLAFSEMLCASNLALSTYLGVSYCVYKGLRTHAPDALKAVYLAPLAAGRWTGTMCLTEPQCGSDLGLVRTRAEPAGDGRWRVTGNKIFITGGEHDLAENIVHLVLARTPNAPAGTRGLSLFLVPKRLPDTDGRPDAANAVRCVGIEHKMGINGSATCALAFEGAEGELIGELHRGLSAMFSVLNSARLAVSIQGVGLAEAALQRARDYARTRQQGRFVGGALHPELPADPILVHPDVRAGLLALRALAEGGRALACWIGLHADLAARAPDAARREECDDVVQLMTPILKSCLTEAGVEAANLAMQLFGGHGYIRDHGVEQLARDARIGPLYEGTNGIQALDLVGRKLPRHYGRLLRRFFHPLDAYLEAHRDDARRAAFVAPLARAFGRLQQATLQIVERGAADPVEAAAVARDYAQLFALVAQAWLWAQAAEIALAKLDGGDDAAFYRTKLATARYFFSRVLPRASASYAAVMAGAAPVMEAERELL